MTTTKIDENGELFCVLDNTRAGDRIPNSRFVRAFCQHCQEAIRVPTERVLDSYCSECEPSHKIYREPQGAARKGLSHLVDYDGDIEGNGSIGDNSDNQ
jgi:hypothetical protein